MAKKQRKFTTQNTYVAAQKRFDKLIRKKREFNRMQRLQLLFKQKRSPRQFWQDKRNLGISESGKPTNIPAEVELEDGSICSDKGVVLNKWYTCFKSLLNNVHSVSSSQCQLDLGLGGIDSAELTVRITGEEVESALAHAPRHKAIGVDSLDPSYLHHEALIAFFQPLLHICKNALLHGKEL